MSNFFSPSDWSALVSAGIGGLIAGFFSLKAVGLTYKKEREKKNKEEEELVKAFLRSIKTEIENLWKIYMRRMGKYVEDLPAESALLMYWPVKQNYFNVYEGNSTLIGNIKNENLRNLIILTYIQAKGLVDSFLLNNEMVQKQENYNLGYLKFTDPIERKYWQDCINTQQKILIEYAKGLKEQHHELKCNVEDLLKKLSEGENE